VGKVETLRPETGERIGAFIGLDGQGGVWASTGGGALRYDTKTKQWARVSNPQPNMTTYGMTGDRDGNGWWSTSNPSDGLVKADIKTGKSTFVALPRPANDRSELFTREELAFFEKSVRLNYTGLGRPGAQAIRKPGADPKRDVMWAPGWFGGLVKVDTKTNKATSYPYPQGESNANAYEAKVDADGNVWVAFTHDDMIAKFDPKTEKWTSYYLPTIGVKTHGLVTTSVNGKTYVGMGYLAVGKVAKLEFRTREELQALKSGARRAQ
jgi:streptogramin lyase